MARSNPTRSAKIRDLAVGQGRSRDVSSAEVPWLDLYGPGSADFLEFRDKRQVGPLIDPGALIPKPGSTFERPTPREMENNFRSTPLREPVWDTPIPDSKILKTNVAQADTGTRSDAVAETKPAGKGKDKADPKSSTPSNSMMKGNKAPPSTDPMMSGPLAGLLSLLSGIDPFASMGGGSTTVPKGAGEFTQMPDQMDVPMRNPFLESGPDETILANLIRGPQPMPADQTVEMTEMPPMMREAQKAAQYGMQPPAPAPQAPPAPSPSPATPAANAPALRPPMPAKNPMLQATNEPGFVSGANDLRSIGMMLNELFGGGGGLNPPMPQRNPMFTGEL